MESQRVDALERVRKVHERVERELLGGGVEVPELELGLGRGRLVVAPLDRGEPFGRAATQGHTLDLGDEQRLVQALRRYVVLVDHVQLCVCVCFCCRCELLSTITVIRYR